MTQEYTCMYTYRFSNPISLRRVLRFLRFFQKVNENLIFEKHSEPHLHNDMGQQTGSLFIGTYKLFLKRYSTS